MKVLEVQFLSKRVRSYIFKNQLFVFKKIIKVQKHDFFIYFLVPYFFNNKKIIKRIIYRAFSKKMTVISPGTCIESYRLPFLFATFPLADRIPLFVHMYPIFFVQKYKGGRGI